MDKEEKKKGGWVEGGGVGLESLLIPVCRNICGNALVSSAKAEICQNLEHLVIYSGMYYCPHPTPRRSPTAPIYTQRSCRRDARKPVALKMSHVSFAV